MNTILVIYCNFQCAKLAYLVEYVHKLKRVTCPQEVGSGVRQLIEQHLRKSIQTEPLCGVHRRAALGCTTKGTAEEM